MLTAEVIEEVSDHDILLKTSSCLCHPFDCNTVEQILDNNPIEDVISPNETRQCPKSIPE